MQETLQTEGQSVFDHCMSVSMYIENIMNDTLDVKTIKNIPNWYYEYKSLIKENSYSKEILMEYASWHDCGKPFCVELDEHKKQHFPNHAKKSKEIYNLVNEHNEKTEIISELIEHDMLFHSESIDSIMNLNLSKQTICSLILSSLSAILSNAQMFGGYDSDSFKIKMKSFSKKTIKILSNLFSHKYVYVIVRNDLSYAQKAVQSCHAIIESTKTFGMSGDHPSVIICVVKSEQKLKKVAEEISKQNIKFSSFFEPDIGNQMTAIATEALPETKRYIFKRFQLMV